MDERNKEEWPNQSKETCNIFRFTEHLNFVNNGGEFDTNYCNIFPEELELVQENNDKHESSFLDLDSKIRDRKFSS